MAWLEHYAPQSQAVIIHRHAKAILPERVSQSLFRLLLCPERSKRDTAQFRRDVIRLGLRKGAHLRDRLSGRGRVWLNPGHTGLDVPGLEDWCRRRDLRPVYLVHDLIPITHPQFCRDGEEARHRRRMTTVISTAKGVVANSDHTLEIYNNYANSTGAVMSPAVVAWPGTPLLPISKVMASNEASFIVLGTIEGRKNHKLLLSVWQELLKNCDSAAPASEIPKLLIVGRRGWQADDVFESLDNHDFHGRVVEVGPLDDFGLAAALKNARALLFPSHAEGFGIPLTEALAAGVPVVASDLPVFGEIGQGVPELLPATDQDAWQRAVIDYARPESARRTQQLQRLKAFRPPTWQEHFNQVDRLIALITP
jgi:glycosyltransferase involved in cell wall biosynthesis